MDKWFYSRWTSLAGFVFCLGLLLFAAYLQFQLNLTPCPLCVLQRVLIGFIGLTFLVGALHTPVEQLGKKIHSGFILFFSLLGILVASRHVWLSLQPPSAVTTCSPTLEYMFQNLPLSETLKIFFLGSGDCAKETYRLMGLNIPEWTLICFIGIFLFAAIRYKLGKSERGLA